MEALSIAVIILLVLWVPELTSYIRYRRRMYSN